MKKIAAVQRTIEAILKEFDLAGHPAREYAGNEPLRLVHEELSEGKSFDVLAFYKNGGETHIFRHSEGWGSFAHHRNGWYCEYKLQDNQFNLVYCTEPRLARKMLGQLRGELTAELSGLRATRVRRFSLRGILEVRIIPMGQSLGLLFGFGREATPIRLTVPWKGLSATEPLQDAA